MDLIDTIEKPENLQKIGQWELFSKKRINQLELPFDFRKPKKSNPWRVSHSVKDDYCGIPGLVGQYLRQMKLRPQLVRNGQNSMIVDWAAFKRRLYRLSPLTVREVTFFINLMFHEILEIIKAGYGVKVPHFGTFYAEHTTSLVKRKWVPSTGELKIYNKPSDWKIIHNVKPKYFPDSYSVHVLAKREHMRYAHRKHTKDGHFGSTDYWDRTRRLFLQRRAVLRSQQMDLIGFGDDVLQKVTKGPVMEGKRLAVHGLTRQSCKVHPEKRLRRIRDARDAGVELLTFTPHERIKEVDEWLKDVPDVELPTVTPDIRMLADIKRRALRSIATFTKIKRKDLEILEEEGRLEEAFGDNKEALKKYLDGAEDRFLLNLKAGSESARLMRVRAMEPQEREKWEAKKAQSRAQCREFWKVDAQKKLVELDAREPDKESLDYIFGRPNRYRAKLLELINTDEEAQGQAQLLREAGAAPPFGENIRE